MSAADTREASPTVEGLWSDYGRWIGWFTRRAFPGDDEAARVACDRTLVEAARHVAATPRPMRDGDLWPWLRGIAHEVCLDIRRRGVEPGPAAGGEGPASVPGHLRMHLQLRRVDTEVSRALEHDPDPGPIARAVLAERRRLRQTYERALRGLAVVLVVPRRLARIRDDVGRTTREWSSRFETAFSTSMPSVSRVGEWLAASPTLSQAAAAAAVVVFGVGTAAADPAPPTRAEAVSEARPAGALASPDLGEREVLPVSKAEPATASGPAPDPSQPAVETAEAPKPSEGEPVPETPAPTTPIRPKVGPGPAERVDDPVDEESHEGGTEFLTPSDRVTVDADGDGDDEVSVAPPIVGIGCPPPEERGSFLDATCPVAEEIS